MVMKTGYRNAPPSHFLLNIENFSIIKTKIDRYESEAFEASGYKWKLVVYPNGRAKRGAADQYVSIYLEIADARNLPRGWQVQAIFKMFVFDFNTDQYYTAEDDDREWRFQDYKKEWGFDKFLSVEDLDLSKGYLSEDDACIFGVEVFTLLKQTKKGESLSIIENLELNKFSWSVPMFSELDSEPRFSDVFVTGGQNWKLKAATIDRTFSLHLNLVDSIIPPGERMFVRYKLRIKNNNEGLDDIEKEDSFGFSSTASAHGVSSLISLDDMENPSMGFMSNDNITVEVEFLTILQVKDFAMKA